MLAKKWRHQVNICHKSLCCLIKRVSGKRCDQTFEFLPTYLWFVLHILLTVRCHLLSLLFEFSSICYKCSDFAEATLLAFSNFLQWFFQRAFNLAIVASFVIFINYSCAVGILGTFQYWAYKNPATVYHVIFPEFYP